jgi:glutathione S-transferase
MSKLYHHPLSPASRTARLFLAEKGISFIAIVEKPWEARPEFLALVPGGDVPVYADDDGLTLGDCTTLCEYIEETHPEKPLIGKTPEGRAAVRQLAHFFSRIFYRDVVDTLVVEKAMKRIQGSGVPEALVIRRGYTALEEHMKYLNWLAEQNKWLAGDTLTLADLSAAAHLSVVDYLGDVPWERFGEAKNWYARIKSRPSFRPLLADHIPGLPPPPHYANLDF